LPVIAYGPQELLRTGFSSGAADYLKDPWTPEELHLRALKLAKRLTFLLNGVCMRLEPGRVIANGQAEDISKQERAILGLLLNQRGSCVPRDALSYVARGVQTGTSRTIDVHISNLRKKLNLLVKTDRRSVIRSVKGEGYVFIPEE